MTTVFDLNGVSRDAFVAALGHLFEHSPWIVEQAYERRPFRDAEHLHAELCAVVRGAPTERQLALIRAHPDLAGRLAQAGRLTAESTREQAGAGLDRLSSEELAEFTRRNDAYRERFGFPFVICARLSNRGAILQAMDTRVRNSPDDERLAALAEIEKIAWLRLKDVLGSTQ
jgi:2-oxo-4-hydroxy-4-carboxy-5-ureidoimidazoline decarboxylase